MDVFGPILPNWGSRSTILQLILQDSPSSRLHRCGPGHCHAPVLGGAPRLGTRGRMRWMPVSRMMVARCRQAKRQTLSTASASCWPTKYSTRPPQSPVASGESWQPWSLGHKYALERKPMHETSGVAPLLNGSRSSTQSPRTLGLVRRFRSTGEVQGSQPASAEARRAPSPPLHGYGYFPRLRQL